MPRPNKPKRVKREPVCDSFFPKGRAEQCHEIEMSVEEYETLRLLDYEGMTQAECAREMGIARATVQSLYTEASKKKQPDFWWKQPDFVFVEGIF